MTAAATATALVNCEGEKGERENTIRRLENRIE
jgi:hypothetical protein